MNEDLRKAIIRNEVTKVRDILLQEPSLVDHRYEFGFLPIHLAIQGDDVEMVELLAKSGADINGVNHKGITALHIAQSSEMVDLLLKLGAKINAQSNDGCTPLRVMAADQEALEAMRAILAAGADPEIQDIRGQSPLDVALMRDEQEKVDLLGGK